MVLILMGVSGSGKTSVGLKLAERLGCPFYDADAFHPQSNREKMARGIPLTDGDREPWLDRLARLITQWNREAPLSVLACSALKRSYRDKLAGGGEVRWVYLKGDRELIQKRLAGRSGHFLDPALLDSQFDILEEPIDAITINIDQANSLYEACLLWIFALAQISICRSNCIKAGPDIDTIVDTIQSQLKA